MEFEWDPEKERRNIKKHGISFTVAEHVFDDPHRIERHDDDASDVEDRWQTIGMAGRALFVVYTERGDTTHIISARVAEPFERRIYHGTRTTHTHGWYRVNP
ncbi:MAG: BrnT family toxin [Treponematales bacterium]